MKGKTFSIHTLPLHVYGLHHNPHSHHMAELSLLVNLPWHVIITQILSFTLQLALGFVNATGLDKGVITSCIHHYGIMLFILFAHKPCVSPLHLYPDSEPRQPLILLLSPQLRLFQNVLELESYPRRAFRIDLSHLEIRITFPPRLSVAL